jgi:predicted phosphodiesterase
MEKFALISDIHSNLEALHAVLKDISNNSVQEIFCLGDLVGYGPNPREVIQKAMDWGWTLRGNHEDALLYFALDFNPDAVRSIEWTRDQLNSTQYPRETNFKIWNFLGDLPDSNQKEDILFVHASPRDRTKEYIMPQDIQNREMMAEIFSLFERVCFVGHTHIPGIFTDDFKFYPPNAFAHRLKMLPGKKLLINIGSVGQPRDGDPRASYILFRGDTIEFRRVEYNYKETMKKIRQTIAIPPRFADRLGMGR